jgi:putative ABC transport system permease protein
MSSWRLILLNLWYHRRIHVTVAMGVAVATGVITGALLVGDSVRGSLQDLTQQRLGRIDSLLVAQYPFREALASELARQLQAANNTGMAATDESRNGDSKPTPYVVPLLLTDGTLSYQQTETDQQTGPTSQARGLSIVGCPQTFWQLGTGGPTKPWREDSLAISAQIASDLGVRVGDEVVLRIPRVSQVSADSPLGEKDDTIASRRLTVTDVLPMVGLTRFGLHPSQQFPLNVFLSLNTLQNLLNIPTQVNTLAVASFQTDDHADLKTQLRTALRPQLEDYQLQVEQVSLPDTGSCLQITSNRLVLPPPVVTAIEKIVDPSSLQPAITYLANTLSVGAAKIPYSTICGIDSIAPWGPLFEGALIEKDLTEPVVDSTASNRSPASNQPLVLNENEVVLNAWAARELQASVGDEVTVTYYEPETTHGQPRDHLPPLRLRLRGIIPLQTASNKPTQAADPKLAPELPGVTDQASIHDWDLPFELVETIRPQDETYWDQYAATPKAFVSYAMARRIWNSRWGSTNLIRMPATQNQTDLVTRLLAELKPTDFGMNWLSARQQGQLAASGTTPFAGLFLGFSLFLMISAVMLIALLFQLGVEQRADEVGILLATGFSATRVRGLYVTESMLVAIIGALLGIVAGIGYAQIMIYGMGTWWVAATVIPFLELHFTWTSLMVGFLVGAMVATGTMLVSLRRVVRCSVIQLLAGESTSNSIQIDEPLPRRLRRFRLGITPCVLSLAAVLVLMAIGWEGETQAGAFFGSGALVLIGLLWSLRQRLRQVSPTSTFSLTQLAIGSARRNPNRTLLTVSLAAVASFLIIALGAFRLTPSERGTGGFQWVATADLPLYFDLGSTQGRLESGFAEQDEEILAQLQFHAFKMQPGEDASCLNLYQTTQPRVLGVPKSLANHNQFAWAARAPLPENLLDPWQLLENDLGEDASGQPIIPVILDRDTAYYSLHLFQIGDQMPLKDELDRPVTLQIVGLLAGSMLQGDVLMDQGHFRRLWPSRAGYQFFLLSETPQGGVSLLESRLEDYGFDVTSAEQRLGRFMAVQNTYLSTFQSLGVLGMLLGTLGLAVAQLRGVLERRSELALMGCLGFSNRRLARLILMENMTLLIGGLGLGCAAALVAILPQWILQQATAPWRTLLQMLPLILLAGLIATGLAVRNVLRIPRLLALRGE